MEVSACLVRSCIHNIMYMNGHNQFYLAVHNHEENTWISATLLHAVLYQGLYQ